MSRIPVLGLILLLFLSFYTDGKESKAKPKPHVHKGKTTKNLHRHAAAYKKGVAHSTHHKNSKTAAVKHGVKNTERAQKTKPKAPPAGKSKGGPYNGDGFRVQIYNGTDRGKAQMVRDEFDKHYPGVHSYLSYLAPHYRVKVGDYKKRQDAMGMYREASSSYTPCMIVPDKVVIK
jgi:SPOR domain